jgi:hypothetical protein
MFSRKMLFFLNQSNKKLSNKAENHALNKGAVMPCLGMDSSKYLKWRRTHEYFRKYGESYWVLHGNLYYNEEMYDYYIRNYENGA